MHACMHECVLVTLWCVLVTLLCVLVTLWCVLVTLCVLSLTFHNSFRHTIEKVQS